MRSSALSSASGSVKPEHRGRVGGIAGASIKGLDRLNAASASDEVAGVGLSDVEKGPSILEFVANLLPIGSGALADGRGLSVRDVRYSRVGRVGLARIVESLLKCSTHGLPVGSGGAKSLSSSPDGNSIAEYGESLEVLVASSPDFSLKSNEFGSPSIDAGSDSKELSIGVVVESEDIIARARHGSESGDTATLARDPCGGTRKKVHVHMHEVAGNTVAATSLPTDVGPIKDAKWWLINIQTEHKLSLSNLSRASAWNYPKAGPALGS